MLLLERRFRRRSAAKRSSTMNAVTGTGSQRNAATTTMLPTAAARIAIATHRAIRAGSERFIGGGASGGARAPGRR